MNEIRLVFENRTWVGLPANGCRQVH